MTNYIDTHCHLDMVLRKRKEPSFLELHKRLSNNTLEGYVTVSCEPDSIAETLELMGNRVVYGAFGIHPHEAKYYSDAIEQRLIAALRHPKALAWGETGLDYHYNYSEPRVQRKVFIKQIEMAVRLEKPLVIHSRESEEDTRAILSDHAPSIWKIHLHCYTSSSSLAADLLDRFPNLFIGFTGAITFSNAGALRKIVKEISLERILLETDAPFMAPVPHRGKPSHSGHIPLIAEAVASLKGVPVSDVYQQTRENTRLMYGI